MWNNGKIMERYLLVISWLHTSVPLTEWVSEHQGSETYDQQ